MNVIMIGSFAFKPKGTVSARAFFMARVLVKRGHRVTILMPPYDNLADSGRVWEQDGVRLENMTLHRDDAWHKLVVPLQMARRAVQLDADVVHVFKPIGYSGLAGMWLRWFSRRPLVLDTDDWEGRGGWADVNPYPASWKRLFDWQERWLARHADAVTVVSRTLQTQVWGFGVNPARVVYLPNGPDPDLRDQAKVDEGEKAAVRARLGVGDVPFALYLGHIPHGSDLDLAIDAWPQVGAQMPEARLVIAGAGDGLPRLQAHARAAGVADRVLFPGWIEHEQAPAYWAAADVVVNPYRDTLINRSKCAGKVVAAMAMGKAVVTSRVGENLAYIEDRRSGLLTEPGNIDDLAQAMLAVLSDRGWAAELGREARQRIWERFDWDARVDEIEQAYQIALKKKERGR
ncbi:MAG: glycosyltransferase family 4 protein [Anaerolineae bacterium]|jgi:glycosyltransferase involved in cell wall biosynthesis